MVALQLACSQVDAEIVHQAVFDHLFRQIIIPMIIGLPSKTTFDHVLSQT
jgi:hypothetical protein